MERTATDGAEEVTDDGARSAAAEVLSGEGRVGALEGRQGGAFVFRYHPFPGAERARAHEDALVTGTPLDRDARAGDEGVTASGRARIPK